MRWLALITITICASCSVPNPAEPPPVVGRWVLDSAQAAPASTTKPESTASIAFRADGTYTAVNTFTGKPDSESGTWRRADDFVWLKPAHADREIRLELRDGRLIDRGPYEPGTLIYHRQAEPPTGDNH